MTNLLIYGAYGFTGELIVREAIRRGIRPIIAGRNAERLRSLAQELSLEHRAFSVDCASEHLRGVNVVLNCAGPFSTTAAPMVEACLATSVHYVDVTGEVAVFTYCHSRDQRAKQAGVILLPGAGFDVVPTDCLAATLKQRLPDAITINLALSFRTRPSVGTAKSALEGAMRGGLARRNHRLEAVPLAHDIRKLPFPSGTRWSATLPWGDVFTSGVSTGAPDGKVYAALPLPLAVALRLSNPLRSLLTFAFVQRCLERLASWFSGKGLDQTTDRIDRRPEFWGEAIDAGGHRLVLRFSSPNVYRHTADVAVEIAFRCASQQGRSGYLTPSMLLGADFVTTRPGVTPMVEVFGFA